MAASSIHTGWHFDRANSRLDVFYQGTRAGHFNATGVSITGTLAVTGATTLTGAATLSSTLAVTGAATFSSTTSLGGVVYTWPCADGACGQQLTTNGSATLSWAAASTAESKNLLGALSGEEALRTVMSTPVYRFRYKAPAAGQWACVTHEMTGIVAEEAPWAMQGKYKRAFSPINSFGMLAAAVKELGGRMERLEATR